MVIAVAATGGVAAPLLIAAVGPEVAATITTGAITGAAIGGLAAGGVDVFSQSVSKGTDNIDLTEVGVNTFVGGLAGGASGALSAGAAPAAAGSSLLSSTAQSFAQPLAQVTGNMAISGAAYGAQCLLSNQSPNYEGVGTAMMGGFVAGKIYNYSVPRSAIMGIASNVFFSLPSWVQSNILASGGNH